jgi:Lar family restriction alleviation protein
MVIMKIGLENRWRKMMSDLKPCPFCGYETTRINADFQSGTEDREGCPVAVICPSCAATGPFEYCPPETADKAIKAWNKRAALVPQCPDEGLRNALRDVLKAIAFDNPHAVQDTIWVNGSPIGDFIMCALDEEIDLDELQNAPYRCKKTGDMFAVPDGWVMVPVEPTYMMIIAGCEVQCGSQVSYQDANFMKLEYKAMLSAAPKPSSDNGWLPIESAPRDGTWFLAFNKDGEVRTIHDTTYSELSIGYAEGLRDHWWEYISDNNFCMRFRDPVGWMPLPAAPKPPAGGEE